MQLQESGLTQGEFARQHGVTAAAVQYWRRRHGVRPAAAPLRFLEVQPLAAPAADGYRLELPGGITLLGPGQPSAGFLSELVRYLRAV